MAYLSLFSGRKVLVAAIAYSAAYFVISGSWIGAAAVSAAAGGAPIPDMRLSYAPSALAPMFEALGEQGRAAYLAMNAFDFAFAAIYGLFYFLSLGYLAGKLFPSRPELRFVSAFGLCGAFFDEVENAIFRQAAAGAAPGADSIGGAPAAIAAFSTTAKFSLDVAAMALIALGFIALGLAAVGRRGAPKR